MKVAAIIVGIDGWEQYTLPLIRSLRTHDSQSAIVVVDNASEEPYPWVDMTHWVQNIRTERLCYSAAINRGKRWADSKFGEYDWYIVLSNDVLCTGPFMHLLEQQDGEAVIGPLMRSVHGFEYIEGWCVCIPKRIWDIAGGWDERFLGSDYEDVAYSTQARQHGFFLEQVPELPFVHLDQRQRFNVVDDFWGKNAHNRDLFLREYAAVTA